MSKAGWSKACIAIIDCAVATELPIAQTLTVGVIVFFCRPLCRSIT
jgi:hypothetical protein